MVEKMYQWIAVMVFALALGVSGAAEIQTLVDSPSVSADESFRVIYETQELPDDSPDFSVLEKDFEIVSQRSHSNLGNVNGQVYKQYVWELTLLPKRTGQLSIPSVSFGQDLAPARPITVSAAAPLADGEDPELFFEISAEPTELYVQQSLLYTVRLYRSVVVGNSRIGEPVMANGDAIIERLDDGRSLEQMRKGKRYIVVERRYVVFPQQSGDLNIEPIVFEGQIISRGARPRVKRLRSDEVALKVKPIPASFDGDVWLPSEELTVEEAWSAGDQTLKTGEPVTWTLTVRAKGLTHTQLPELQLDWDERLNAYPDQPIQRDRVTRDGIVGEYTQKFAIIATEAGEFDLPEVQMTWWNTTTDQQALASIPARRLSVVGDASANQPVAVVPPTQVIPSPVPTPETSPDVGVATTPATWPYVVMGLLGLGWLLTTLGWMLSSKKRDRTPQADHGAGTAMDDLSASKLNQSLKKACEQNNAQQAKQALLRLGRLYHSHSGDAMSLTGLAQRYDDKTLVQALKDLDHTLYGAHTMAWSGENLWRAWQQAKHGSDSSKRASHETLHPLVESP